MTVFNSQARVTLGGRRDSTGKIVDGFQGNVSGRYCEESVMVTVADRGHVY